MLLAVCRRYHVRPLKSELSRFMLSLAEAHMVGARPQPVAAAQAAGSSGCATMPPASTSLEAKGTGVFIPLSSYTKPKRPRHRSRKSNSSSAMTSTISGPSGAGPQLNDQPPSLARSGSSPKMVSYEPIAGDDSGSYELTTSYRDNSRDSSSSSLAIQFVTQPAPAMASPRLQQPLATASSTADASTFSNQTSCGSAMAGLMEQLQRILEEMGPEAARTIADAAARVASASYTTSTTNQQQQQEAAPAASSSQLAALMLPPQELPAFSPPRFDQAAAASPLPMHNRLSVTSSTLGMRSPQQQPQQQQQHTRVSPFATANTYSWLPAPEASRSLPRDNCSSRSRYTLAGSAPPVGSPPAAAAATAGSLASGAATSALIASILGSSSSSGALDYSQSQGLSCSSLDNSLQGMLLAQQMDPAFASQLAAPQPLSDFGSQLMSPGFGLLGTSPAAFSASASPMSGFNFTGQASSFTHPMAQATFSHSALADSVPVSAQMRSEPLWSHSPVSLGPMSALASAPLSALDSMEGLALSLGCGSGHDVNTAMPAAATLSGEGWANQGMNGRFDSLVGNDGFRGPVLGFLYE